MSICDRCGGEIIFRHVDGNCIPVHVSGGCRDNSSNYFPSVGYYTSNNSQRFRRLTLSESKHYKQPTNNYSYSWLYVGELTLLTTCWWCGDEVYFHRDENGGCVLFDALGKPWPIHACWEEYKHERKQAVTNILDKHKIALQNTKTVDYKYFSNLLIEPFDAFLIGCDFSKRVILDKNASKNEDLYFRYVVYVVYRIGYIKILVPESALLYLLNEPHIFLEVSTYKRGLGVVNFINKLITRKGDEKLINFLINPDDYLERAWIHQINLID